jgi:Fe-S cluster biogenesis protein NfuA
VWVNRTLRVFNSTLLNNRTTGMGGGIWINDAGSSLEISSTVVAASLSQSATSPAPNVDIANNVGLLAATGANNLVQVTQSVTMPVGTLTASPNLAALADNGCLAPAGASGVLGNVPSCVQTLLPNAGSPVIDVGNNATFQANDQRGGGFPRVVGAGADIGAVERSAAVVNWPITTSVSPVGSGTVACVPNPVPQAGNATCTATANAGFLFVDFTGDCAGATCNLTNVSAARNVVARFQAVPPGTWAVATSATPAGAGAVTCVPNPVANGGNTSCTAVANPGFQFVDFMGDCAGPSCSLTNVTAARNVIARFQASASGVQSIPTLDEWMMILLATLMLLSGGRWAWLEVGFGRRTS